MERKGLEEQKLKEAMAEKTPEWQLFCCLSEIAYDQAYFKNQVEDAFEHAAGDEADRWNLL